MIKGLSGGVGIMVSGGSTSLPYINQNPSNPMQGMMRIWGNDLQVFDGNNWLNVQSSYASATLDSETMDLLNWARTKKKEESALAVLPSDHPAVAIAKENLNKAKEAVKRAEEQLKITEILSHEEQTTS